MTDWLTSRPGGLRLRVKVTARASSSEIRGIEHDAVGGAYLAVRVQAPADDGRANAELLKLLGRRFGVAGGRLTLVRGHRARQKLLDLDDPSPSLVDRLREIEGEGHR